MLRWRQERRLRLRRVRRRRQLRDDRWWNGCVRKSFSLLSLSSHWSFPCLDSSWQNWIDVWIRLYLYTSWSICDLRFLPGFCIKDAPTPGYLAGVRIPLGRTEIYCPSTLIHLLKTIRFLIIYARSRPAIRDVQIRVIRIINLLFERFDVLCRQLGCSESPSGEDARLQYWGYKSLTVPVSTQIFLSPFWQTRVGDKDLQSVAYKEGIFVVVH